MRRTAMTSAQSGMTALDTPQLTPISDMFFISGISTTRQFEPAPGDLSA